MPRYSIRGGMQCAPLPVCYLRIPNELTVVMVTIPSDNGVMTNNNTSIHMNQNLIQDLNDAYTPFAYVLRYSEPLTPAQIEWLKAVLDEMPLTANYKPEIGGFVGRI